MKKIINNKYHLKDNEMTDVYTKVKLLIINSNHEILLAYQKNGYEFPGGTNEIGESLDQTVVRELEEETGIVLEMSHFEPFVCSLGYYKDWPQVGRNKKIEIYYYEVHTDLKPNYDNIHLTDDEKKGNFRLEYVPLDEFENTLNRNTQQYGDERGIAREMLELFEIYKKSL